MSLQDYLFETFGLGTDSFRLVVLPLLIFFARILDVSINTIRIIFMLNGRKWVSTILGFFESLIWLLAIGQIFQNIDNVPTYFAYAFGFASGIMVGMWIEEKLAVGRVVVRIITQTPADDLVKYLSLNNYRHMVLDGTSSEEKVNLVFTVIKRSSLPNTISMIKEYNPQAFYSIESVKKVSDDDILTMRESRWSSKLKKH
jgi:uncharacterized protein YebE (UPF0316 family)